MQEMKTISDHLKKEVEIKPEKHRNSKNNVFL